MKGVYDNLGCKVMGSFRWTVVYKSHHVWTTVTPSIHELERPSSMFSLPKVWEPIPTCWEKVLEMPPKWEHLKQNQSKPPKKAESKPTPSATFSSIIAEINVISQTDKRQQVKAGFPVLQQLISISSSVLHFPLKHHWHKFLAGGKLVKIVPPAAFWMSED